MGASAMSVLAAALWMCLWAGLVFAVAFIGVFIVDLIAERLWGRAVIAKEKRPGRRGRGA